MVTLAPDFVSLNPGYACSKNKRCDRRSEQRFPDAVQREAVHRWSGTALDSASVAIPGQQRTTSLRHSASKTRVNALSVLRCARETSRYAYRINSSAKFRSIGRLAKPNCEEPSANSYARALPKHWKFQGEGAVPNREDRTMTSLHTKLVLSALGIALLSGPAVARQLPDQSNVIVNGQIVGADPDAQIRTQLLREWDFRYGE
jgi:hypothetical protein